MDSGGVSAENCIEQDTIISAKNDEIVELKSQLTTLSSTLSEQSHTPSDNDDGHVHLPQIPRLATLSLIQKKT